MAFCSCQALAPACDVIQHFFRPEHKTDSVRGEIFMYAVDVSRQNFRSGAFFAAFAKPVGVKFIVTYLHDLRTEHVDNLVHDVEQELICIGI